VTHARLQGRKRDCRHGGVAAIFGSLWRDAVCGNRCTSSAGRKDPVIKRSRRVGRKPSQFARLTRSARTVCRNYRRLAYKAASNFNSPEPPVAPTLFVVRSDGTPVPRNDSSVVRVRQQRRMHCVRNAIKCLINRDLYLEYRSRFEGIQDESDILLQPPARAEPGGRNAGAAEPATGPSGQAPLATIRLDC